jgi:predicted glycosyltransferase
LIYSHDTFGLGHLRRCRTIAHALVERFKGLSVLILSGSPIIGSFDFRARVDFVRIPGVIKLHNGEYTSLGLHIDIQETLAMRASIIRHTAEAFAPDLFLVDKEPLGLEGEVEPTLRMLHERGTVNVLGLRDVLDDPVLLKREWHRKHAMPAVRALYDEIWVYGPQELGDPLAGLDLDARTRQRVVHTGYLDRSLPSTASRVQPASFEVPYLLVTAGGGGDGAMMFDWVLRAYEADRGLPHPALFVLGPFMQPDAQREFMARAERLADVAVLTFDAHMELLVQDAAALVAMGGYNTFCEILSFDKPALLIPRSQPRREQLIRARRAQELGLTSMLDPAGARDTESMIAALRRLDHQAPPSAAGLEGLLDGLDVITSLVDRRLGGEVAEYGLLGAHGS